MKRSSLAFIATALFLTSSTMRADENTTRPTILEHIQADSVIVVVGPEDPLVPAEGELTDDDQGKHVDRYKDKQGRMGGYRVQVFSDNNARSAKSEAYRRASAIQSRFPGHRTYVTYSAPYWRVRIGDFRTSEDANNLASQIRSAFPAYGREVRVTKDRVTIKN